MAEKDVTGVICLPLPALNRGRHTLNCIYRDGKYNVKNRCFEIQVVSATVNINGGNGEEGRPNSTVHFVLQVTNERGQPVKDGQVKMYYNSVQDNSWAEQAMQEQQVDVELDTQQILNDGRVTFEYRIPNNFRAGVVRLRFRYDLSHEGYDDKSIELPVYVYYDGNLELEYKYGIASDNLYELDEFNNVPLGNKLYCFATLYDGTGANKIPMSNIPINFKMNEGTLENDTTNESGQCSANTPIINDTRSFTMTVKNEEKRYLGTHTITDTFYPSRKCTLENLDVITQVVDGQLLLDTSIELGTDAGASPVGREVQYKLNGLSIPKNGDFANGNGTKVGYTDDEGKCNLAWDDISLTAGNTYSFEANVGGGQHIMGLKLTDLGSIKWASPGSGSTTGKARLYGLDPSNNNQFGFLMEINQ